MTGLDGLSERVARGGAVTEDDAPLILESRDLIGVGMLADDARRQRHGARTSFVRVLDVHVNAVPAAAPAGLSAGEIRIGGCPSSLEAAVAAVRTAVAFAGSTPVTGFSLTDLQALASDFGATCAALREAGLFGISEVPVDLTEDAASVEEARSRGLAVTRLTVHALAADARVEVVARARDFEQRVGGFRMFAPLPRTTSITEPSTGYDDVKQIALARLIASNIATIQVDWSLYGPKLAQVALTVGADDVDDVAAVEPGLLGGRRSAIEEIRTNIRAAGLDPWERDARFEAMA